MKKSLAFHLFSFRVTRFEDQHGLERVKVFSSLLFAYYDYLIKEALMHQLKLSSLFLILSLYQHIKVYSKCAQHKIQLERCSQSLLSCT